MDKDLMFVDFIADDDYDDHNIYDYCNDTNYKKCPDCDLKYKENYLHCCQCGNKWKDLSQIYCDKCYKSGILYFNSRGVNITGIFEKFNGYGKLCNIQGKTIFAGNIRNGKYNSDGILYFSNGNVQYKGRFKDGLYDGFGVLIQDDIFTNAVFKDSKIIIKLKESSFIENKKKEICNLCVDDYNETELFPICGLKKCTECCAKCIKYYFENINANRGSVLKPNLLLCPFCRNYISDDIIKIYNPELGKHIEKLKKIENPKEILGVCSECDECEIRELNIECGEQANKEKFVCRKCLEIKSFDNVKRCPNCKIKVYRIDGCHWMKCKCNIAWCWHCSAIFDVEDKHTWNCRLCGK